MSQLLKMVTFGSKITEDMDERIDTRIVSNIMSYIYGDRKNARQIAKKLGLHILKITLYLDFMVNTEMISCCEEEEEYGLERYFFVEKQGLQVNVETKVKGEHALIKVANEMGEKTKEVIQSLKKEDLKNISYTIAMISEKDAEKVLQAQKEIEELMTKLENVKEVDDIKANRYILMSTFAPYKFDKEECLSEDNTR